MAPLRTTEDEMNRPEIGVSVTDDQASKRDVFGME